MVLGLKGRRCVSHPILHNDKGLKGPTNLSWIREAGREQTPYKALWPRKNEVLLPCPHFIINSVFYCSKLKIT